MDHAEFDNLLHAPRHRTCEEEATRRVSDRLLGRASLRAVPAKCGTLYESKRFAAKRDLVTCRTCLHWMDEEATAAVTERLIGETARPIVSLDGIEEIYDPRLNIMMLRTRPDGESVVVTGATIDDLTGPK